MQRKQSKNSSIPSLVLGIDRQRLGLSTDDRHGDAAEVAAILDEKGPLDKKEITEEFERRTGRKIKPNTMGDCVLRPCHKAGLFGRHRRIRESGSGTSLFNWSFKPGDARRLRKEHPAPPPPKPLSRQKVQQCLSDFHDRSTGLSTVQGNRLQRVIVWLSEGPRSTSEIEKFLGINADLTRWLLGAAFRLRLLGKKRRYTGRTKGKPGGQKDALWFHDADGIKSFKDRMPERKRLTWPITLLLPAVREEIERTDYERDGFDETEAWWAANIISMIRLAAGRLHKRRDELGLEYGLVPETLRPHVEFLEDKDHIVIERPTRRGKRTRPINTYLINEQKQATLRSGTPVRPLSPGRAMLHLEDLWPQEERWTPQQRLIVETIDQKIAGLSDEEIVELLGMTSLQWRCSRPVLATVGNGLEANYHAFAQMVGCNRGQLEGHVRQVMKPTGWFHKNGKYCSADWETLASIAGVKKETKRRSRRSSKAATNGQPAEQKPPEQTPPPKRKEEKTASSSTGPDSEYKVLIEFLDKHLPQDPKARPKELRKLFTQKHPGEPLPPPRSSNFRVIVLRRKKKLGIR